MPRPNSRPTPNTNTFSATDVRQLSTADFDCYDVWGAPCVAVSFATTGSLKVERIDGTTGSLNFSGYPNGYRIDVQFAKVYLTGSTCTGIMVYGNKGNVTGSIVL